MGSVRVRKRDQDLPTTQQLSCHCNLYTVRQPIVGQVLLIIEASR